MKLKPFWLILMAWVAMIFGCWIGACVGYANAYNGIRPPPGFCIVYICERQTKL